MTAATTAITIDANTAPRGPRARERNARQGVRHCAEIVGAHIAGQRRGEEFISSLRGLMPGGDELLTLATLVASDASFEGRAHARGCFRAIQKRLEQVTL